MAAVAPYPWADEPSPSPPCPGDGSGGEPPQPSDRTATSSPVASSGGDGSRWPPPQHPAAVPPLFPAAWGQRRLMASSVAAPLCKLDQTGDDDPILASLLRTWPLEWNFLCTTFPLPQLDLEVDAGMFVRRRITVSDR